MASTQEISDRLQIDFFKGQSLMMMWKKHFWTPMLILRTLLLLLTNGSP